ncbi:MAG: hypothetical protein ACOZNI_25995 [Myxococcota bacterium]
MPAVDSHWLVVPNLAWDADDKLGFGARGEYVREKPGREPYAAAWVVHLFATTNGYHHHRLRFDLVGEDLRLTGHFAFRAWLNDGYWGIGNGTVREAPDDVYRYTLYQPYGQLTLRRELAGPLAAFVSANGRWSGVEPHAGSLLAAQDPYGTDGGAVGQLAGGVLFDTRSPEVTPERGVLLELSARGVGGAYWFAGPFASARAWTPLGTRVVLGGRVMAEWLVGEVPFYEMVHWGGSQPIAGFGGSDTIRGIPFGRWRGPGKSVANVEGRVDVVKHRFLKEELRWQVVPFVDAGATFGAGDTATAPPPAFPLHYTVGGGVRAIWAETMVGRVDAGAGPDATDTGEPWGWGLYLMFDHMF